MIEYMGFRHFFRHSYLFFLDWDELKKLVLPLEEVWKQAKEEIEVFLNSIDKNQVARQITPGFPGSVPFGHSAYIAGPKPSLDGPVFTKCRLRFSRYL